MFGKNTNNNSNNVNSNTTFDTHFSDLSSLTIGGWNNMISIRLLPAVGKDANGMTQYNKDSRIQTSLTLDNAAALLEGIEKTIIPAYRTGDPGNGVSTAVSMGGGKNSLSITYQKDENGVPSFYLVFAQNLNQNGATTEDNIIRYKFNKTEYIDGYNPTTGGGNVEVTEAEFFNFVEKLRNRNELSGMTAHSMKYSKAISDKFSAVRNTTPSFQDNSTGSDLGGFGTGPMGLF